MKQKQPKMASFHRFALLFSVNKPSTMLRHGGMMHRTLNSSNLGLRYMASFPEYTPIYMPRLSPVRLSVYCI